MEGTHRIDGWRLTLAVFLAVALLPARRAQAQQELGHKVLGTIGLKAGSQPPEGLYAADRVLFYSANKLMDRDGNEIPVGLDLNAFANGIGVAGSYKLRPLATYLNAAISVPFAHLSINTRQPEASIDRYGLGDLYVQPLKLGWRLPQLDLVAGYAFYAPTGRFTPGGTDGVGRGHWTHELSAGGTVSFDLAGSWHLSALASLDLNQRKQGVDITRGNTIQIQGGAGKTLLGVIDAGIAGYAEWQVSDDSGADLPPVLLGVRDRAFGIGPEIDVLIALIRGKLTLRYVREVWVHARPQGQIFVIGLTFTALQGEKPGRAP